MIRYIGDDGITTRRMLESILAVKEEHADDLVSLLVDIDENWKTRDRSARRRVTGLGGCIAYTTMPPRPVTCDQ